MKTLAEISEEGPVVPVHTATIELFPLSEGDNERVFSFHLRNRWLLSTEMYTELLQCRCETVVTVIVIAIVIAENPIIVRGEGTGRGGHSEEIQRIMTTTCFEQFPQVTNSVEVFFFVFLTSVYYFLFFS